MQYRETPESDGQTLLQIAQQMSSILYFISEEKTRKHKAFQQTLYDLITHEKMNVNRAENYANVLHPELYQLRYILRAGYEILNIIRSQVSYLKQELINTNTL